MSSQIILRSWKITVLLESESTNTSTRYILPFQTSFPHVLSISLLRFPFYIIFVISIFCLSNNQNMVTLVSSVLAQCDRIRTQSWSQETTWARDVQHGTRRLNQEAIISWKRNVFSTTCEGEAPTTRPGVTKILNTFRQKPLMQALFVELPRENLAKQSLEPLWLPLWLPVWSPLIQHFTATNFATNLRTKSH